MCERVLGKAEEQGMQVAGRAFEGVKDRQGQPGRNEQFVGSTGRRPKAVEEMVAAIGQPAV